MPIHVTTSTTQSLSNKTFVDRLSTTGVVYADSGNSSQWSSTYGSVYATSATWDSAYTSLNTNSAKYDSTYTTVSSNSAYWDSTYNTVYTTSGSWDYQGVDIKALTANWENTYTTVGTYSASWGAGGGTDSQTLSFDESNARLSISSGNFVSLSALSSSGGGGGGGTDSQTLSFNVDNAQLSILNGNTVSLSARVTENIIRTSSFPVSTGLTNVSPLSTTVAPNEKILIEIIGVKSTSSNTEGMTIALTGPGDATFARIFLEAWISTTGSRVVQAAGFNASATDASGNTNAFPFQVTCIAEMGASGGTIQFQVGAENPGVGSVTIAAGTFMRVHRIP